METEEIRTRILDIFRDINSRLDTDGDRQMIAEYAMFALADLARDLED